MDFSAVMPRKVEMSSECNDVRCWRRRMRAAIVMTLIGSLAGNFGLSQNAGSQLTPTGMQLLPILDTVAVDPLLFGESVSVSGDLAVVGAPADSAAATSSGSARVFERLGENWSEVALLRPSAPAMGEHFGFSVSISSTVVLVGSPESESAYLFTRTGRGWSETAKLTVSDLPQGSRFGHAVALDGDYAVVGASPGGAAYVFELRQGVWTQVAKLTPSLPTQAVSFGLSVAISGDVVAVGAAEAAFVYRRQGGTWSLEAVLSSPDSGPAVSVSHDLIAQGGGGIVRVFSFKDNAWTESAVLGGSTSSMEDNFGSSVSLNDGSLLVGAPEGRSMSGIRTGTALLFHNRLGSWTEVARFFPQRSDSVRGFGGAVATDLESVLIGAIEDGSEIESPSGATGMPRHTGAAYVFGL